MARASMAVRAVLAMAGAFAPLLACGGKLAGVDLYGPPASAQDTTAGNDGSNATSPQPGEKPKPPVVPAGVPTPGTTGCQTYTLGDGSSCKETSAWGTTAVSLCRDQGLDFTSASFHGSCGPDRSLGVDVTCCEPSPNVPKGPQPSVCEDHHIGPEEGNGCIRQAMWLQIASDTCAATGTKVTYLGPPSTRCNPPSDATDEIKFTCCR